jgi:pseudouridine kinase
MLCLGAAHIDQTIKPSGSLQRGTSNPVEITTGCGGVAFNVSIGLAHLGHRVALCACVGGDDDGHRILKTARTAGVETKPCLIRTSRSTGRYIAALDPDGGLAYGFSDTRLCEDLTAVDLAPFLHRREEDGAPSDRIWFVDTNLPEHVLAWLAEQCPAATLLIADTVSVAKATRIAALTGRLSILRTNRAEAEALVARPGEPLVPLARTLAERIGAAVVLTDGSHGTVVVSGPGAFAPAWLVPAPPVAVVDVTGAGDAATAGMIHGLATGASLVEAVILGHGAAALTLSRHGAVFDDLSPDLLTRSAAEVPPYLDL